MKNGDLRVLVIYLKRNTIYRRINLKITASDIDAIRLPGYQNANELVFVNGRFVPGLSTIRSSEKSVLFCLWKKLQRENTKTW